MQAQILELIGTLQEEYGSAVMLITHDLGVIAETADRVMVMYAGHAVEVADVNELFDTPTHPYTVGLLGSVHSLDDSSRGGLQTISGAPPSLINLPTGCAFHPRCRFELGENSLCRTEAPQLHADAPGNEIQAPMGVVILGGLLTSTALNMIVVPVLFRRFGRAEATAA